MPVALFILLAILLLVILSGGYVFWIGCIRRKEQPWLDEHKIQKTSYGKFYKYMCNADKWLKDHNASDIYIKSSDGLNLHGLWIPSPRAKGTVLLAHGYRSTILLDLYVAYVFLYGLGFNLLIPDQRAHGKSAGKYITFGVKESDDMHQWIVEHNQRFGKYPLVMFGISMGASTVLYLANEELPDNVRGIVADCGFTSPRDILASVYQNVVHLPPVPSLWVTEWFARVFAGFSLTQKDTRSSLANSKLPVLLIHGKEDRFVPCHMTTEAYEACRSHKMLLLVEKAEHGLSFMQDPQQYKDALMEFFNNNIEGFE